MLARVEAARFLLVPRQVVRRPEAAAAPVTDVADSGPGAVQGATLAAEEGRHVVDEDVVLVQAKQMHLMLRLRPAVGRLAHQMALEVALAGHLLATPVPHVDVDEAAVGPLKLRDVGAVGACAGTGGGAATASSAGTVLGGFGLFLEPGGRPLRFGAATGTCSVSGTRSGAEGSS